MAVIFKLHHIGIVAPNLGAPVERFADRFGYSVKTGDIHDPVQQASVKFLEPDAESPYVEFVAPDNPQSRLNRMAQRGGRLHHLCYSTDNIDAACEELRAKGLSLVRAPAAATAFAGRRIAWLMGRDELLFELVETGSESEL